MGSDWMMSPGGPCNVEVELRHIVALDHMQPFLVQGRKYLHGQHYVCIQLSCDLLNLSLKCFDNALQKTANGNIISTLNDFRKNLKVFSSQDNLKQVNTFLSCNI